MIDKHFFRKVFILFLLLSLPFQLKAGSLGDLILSPQVQGAVEDALEDANDPSQFYLALAAIFQNDAEYLREWIEYHKMIGIEHFYLYNNLSQDNYLEVLDQYIECGEVELIEWPYESIDNGTYDRVQCNAYRDALERCDCKWLAIIDTDEFLVPVKENNLKDFLSQFEGTNLGGVVLPWVFFGTSNIEKVPADKLMIETLVLNGGAACGGDPSAIWNGGAYKSIVRPRRVSGLVSPHYCFYKSGYDHMQVSFDIGQINHYWTRDEAFFREEKIPRRAKWGFSESTSRSWERGMNQKTKFGNRITRFVPLLRQIMGLPNEK